MATLIRRVMIVGGPGSGKSWLATRLGDLSALPVYHMDHIHWLPGWVERGVFEKDMLTRRIHRQDGWIFEGGHSRTYAERAHLLIWLDLPVGLRMRRVILRNLQYAGRRRPDMAPGCIESVGRQTIRFLRFIWRTRDSGRVPVQRIIDRKPPGLRIVHLTTPDQVDQFLARCRAANTVNGLLLDDAPSTGDEAQPKP